MASCSDILRSEFPELDGEVFAYVTGERRPVSEESRQSLSGEGGRPWVVAR